MLFKEVDNCVEDSFVLGDVNVPEEEKTELEEARVLKVEEIGLRAL